MIAHGGNIFAASREHGWDWRDVLDFSASINPLGPAPGVTAAIQHALNRIGHYPEPYASRLTRALGERWNIDPDRILAGNGATELIHFLSRVWPQEEVTLVVPAFSEFHRAYPTAATVSVDNMWPDDGLLVLSDPNNPTGKALTVPDRRGPTLVDESFIEFTDLPSAMHRDCLVLRSLTKFEALPGLRVGALVGPPELMRALRAQREPWQVNVLAEAAALAAIEDDHHARRTREFVASERERVFGRLRELPGVAPVSGLANFLLVRLQYSSDRLCAWMLQRRVLLRNCSGWPGVAGEAVRIAIRTSAENDRLFALWREFPCD